MTWTVVVEVHIGDKGTVFTVGKFPYPQDAAAFADTLEWELGENKITASILRNENFFEWFPQMKKKAKALMRIERQRQQEVRRPPCCEDY